LASTFEQQYEDGSKLRTGMRRSVILVRGDLKTGEMDGQVRRVGDEGLQPNDAVVCLLRE
jgi:hypothetical protein